MCNDGLQFLVSMSVDGNSLLNVTSQCHVGESEIIQITPLRIEYTAISSSYEGGDEICCRPVIFDCISTCVIEGRIMKFHQNHSL